MKKIEAIKAIEAAGISNDSTGMVRIYTENRISYASALEAWTRGCRMRHAKKTA